MDNIKKRIDSMLISFSLVFRQCGKFLSSDSKRSVQLGGNLDPFYIFGFAAFWKSMKSRSKINYYLIFSFLIILIFQVMIIPNYQFQKGFFSLGKIYLSVYVLIYAMSYVKNVDFNFIVNSFTIFNALVIFFALTIGKNSFLWRFNDGVNLYTLTRLQSIFLEPSELGYHTSIILIILIARILIKKRVSLIEIILLIVNMIALYLARPMGSILFLGLSVMAMVIMGLVIYPIKNKFKFFVGIALSFTLIIAYLYYSDSPIMLRLIATLSGNDGSNNYRIGVSLKVLRQTLIDYRGTGAGIGMINTPDFISSYRHLGLTTVMVNSFLYFATEAGVLGIAFIIFGIYVLFKKSLSQRSILKVGILVFIVGYQFSGSHFTSGMNWFIYGLIMNKHLVHDSEVK